MEPEKSPIRKRNNIFQIPPFLVGGVHVIFYRRVIFICPAFNQTLIWAIHLKNPEAWVFRPFWAPDSLTKLTITTFLGFSYSAGSLVAINCHKKLCCFGCLQFTLDITEECFDLSTGGRSSGLHICFFSVKKAQGKPKLCKMYTLDILMNGYNVMPWCICIYIYICLKWWFETQGYLGIHSSNFRVVECRRLGL